MTLALVPMKDLGNAKMRLSPILNDAERMGLVYAMLQDVITALRAAKNVDEIAIIAHDRGYIDFGVGFIEEAFNAGYNEALSVAQTKPLLRDVNAIIILPGDVPMVTTKEIEKLSELPTKNLIRIAAARDGCGTNGLMFSPPDRMQTAFGENSFQQHLTIAKSIGASIEIVEGPGIAFDIDTPKDLIAFCGIDGENETHTYLDVSGIRRRLLDINSNLFKDDEE